jgi:transcriptional regulator with XRE-family HTH domain
MSESADRPSATGESLGTRLRRERERRQIALASIAANSKISVSLFEALERDDASRWPSGIVFRRAFIRAYAEAVGLDPEATAREFLERFPDPAAPEPFPVATPPVPAQPVPAIRVTIAAKGRSFVGGRVLASTYDRFVAVACDSVVVATLGLTCYLVVGSFWMPLCLALAGYYAGGILLLGNSPGVCLCAPDEDPTTPAGGAGASPSPPFLARLRNV